MPTSSADLSAAPRANRRSTCGQALPASPTTASAPTATFSNVTSHSASPPAARNLRRATPCAPAGTSTSVRSSGASPERARQTIAAATPASRTNSLVPFTCRPPAAGRTLARTWAAIRPPPGSAIAVVMIDLPSAMRGSQWPRCAGDPASSSRIPASTTVENRGLGTAPCPRASTISASSNRLKSEPPYSAGNTAPAQPIPTMPESGS